jgi:hypothetical protein
MARSSRYVRHDVFAVERDSGYLVADRIGHFTLIAALGAKLRPWPGLFRVALSRVI